MRLFARSITLLAIFLLSGTLGFSTPQSARADESRSPGSDAADNKSDKKEPWKPEDDLILSSLTEDKEIRLTRGSDNKGQPQWSPDGQLIVFTSNRLRPGVPDGAQAEKH